MRRMAGVVMKPGRWMPGALLMVPWRLVEPSSHESSLLHTDQMEASRNRLEQMQKIKPVMCHSD